MADQIGLIANLPAIHDRQLAQNNHNEMMGAIRAVQTNHDELVGAIRAVRTNLSARLDGLEMRLMAK
jgi:hypothetical protein